MLMYVLILILSISSMLLSVAIGIKLLWHYSFCKIVFKPWIGLEISILSRQLQFLYLSLYIHINLVNWLKHCVWRREKFVIQLCEIPKRPKNLYRSNYRTICKYREIISTSFRLLINFIGCWMGFRVSKFVFNCQDFKACPVQKTFKQIFSR